jgi:hypothetical protein
MLVQVRNFEFEETHQNEEVGIIHFLPEFGVLILDSFEQFSKLCGPQNLLFDVFVVDGRRLLLQLFVFN